MSSTLCRVVFRADGNSKIGLGHVVRNLALVSVLKDRFSCLFLIRDPEDAILRMIGSLCKVQALPHFATLQEEINHLRSVVLQTDIVVLDSYEFDSDYQQEVKRMAHKLVAFDDYAKHHFYADLVINQGASGSVSYQKEPYTRVLQGFNYLILRPEFYLAATDKRQIAGVETVFICFGGADPFNITVKALRASLHCDFITDIRVVTGSAYRFSKELAELVAVSGGRITHLHDISAADMVESIKRSQVAICPASSVSLEVCAVGCGLLTGTVIDNQEHLHQQLVETGCALSIGDFNDVSEEELSNAIRKLANPFELNQLVGRQRVTIDGLSGSRVLAQFEGLSEC